MEAARFARIEAVSAKREQFPPDDSRSVCACDHTRGEHAFGCNIEGCYCDSFRWAPWKGEPDRVEWRTLGYPALIVRNESMGNLCGYVGVPPGHPWHGRDLRSLDENVRVHGGVTYAEGCHGAICHVPQPGEPDDVWWVGFDCAHAQDLAPYSHELIRPLMMERHRNLMAQVERSPLRDSYKTVEYVRAQVERLAKQAANAAGN